MQLLASHMTHTWLMDTSQANPIGELSNFILDSKSLHVRYIRVAVVGERTPYYIREDHIQWKKHILLIQTSSHLGQPDDFIRDQALLASACNPIGYKVLDEQKHLIGRVQDFSFSSVDGKVERLMIHPVWWQSFFHSDRIIARSSVKDVSVSKRTITINASDAKIPAQAAKPIPA